MLPFLFRRLYSGPVFLRNNLKNHFNKNTHYYLQSFYSSTNVMPPKRKAASGKTGPAEEADIAGGGDQLEPTASKTRRVKDKDTAKVEVKEKDGGKAVKKTAKKELPTKGKTKEDEKEIPEKKKSTRGKAVKAKDVEDEAEAEDTKFDKVTKRKVNKDDDSNGVAKERATRKKKAGK